METNNEKAFIASLKSEAKDKAVYNGIISKRTTILVVIGFMVALISVLLASFFKEIEIYARFGEMGAVAMIIANPLYFLTFKVSKKRQDIAFSELVIEKRRNYPIKIKQAEERVTQLNEQLDFLQKIHVKYERSFQ